MIGDVKMQTIKRRTGRSLTGDRPLFLALLHCQKMKVETEKNGYNEVETKTVKITTSKLYFSIFKNNLTYCRGFFCISF